MYYVSLGKIEAQETAFDDQNTDFSVKQDDFEPPATAPKHIVSEDVEKTGLQGNHEKLCHANATLGWLML